MFAPHSLSGRRKRCPRPPFHRLGFASSRQTASRHQKNHPARTASLAMASPNGVLSPPAHLESASSSGSLSAKRKRDDAIDTQNGDPESKSLVPSGISKEDSQALVRDLIDVLKRYVRSPSLILCCDVNWPLNTLDSNGPPSQMLIRLNPVTIPPLRFSDARSLFAAHQARRSQSDKKLRMAKKSTALKPTS